MPNFVNKMKQVGLGVESARGTPVTPAIWVKNLSINHNDKRNYLKDESAMGNIAEAHDDVVDKEWGEGELAGILDDTVAGYLLKNVLGAVASAAHAGETTVYDHDFTLAQDNVHPSLTIETKNPLEQKKFALAMIDSLKIKCEVGRWVEFTASFRSKKGVDAANTVSYTSYNKLFSKMVTAELAATYAGLGSGAALVLKSFEIDFDNQLEDEMKLGSTEPNDINNTVFKLSGNMKHTFGATTVKDYFRDGTFKALRLSMVSTSQAGVVPTNPAIILDLAKVAFEEWEENDDIDKMAEATIKFTGLYSISDATIGKVRVTNAKANYTT